MMVIRNGVYHDAEKACSTVPTPKGLSLQHLHLCRSRRKKKKEEYIIVIIHKNMMEFSDE